MSAELAAKYMHDRHLPDKAIDVLDEAGARMRMLTGVGPAILPAEGAGTIAGATQKPAPTLITEHEIEQVVSRMAKIPPRTVAVSEKERLQNLEADLRKVIYGQDHAIRQVVSAIKIARSGLGHPEKPVGSFLFS